MPFLIQVLPLTKSHIVTEKGEVLYKDAKLLKNRVIPLFRCVVVKKNILRRFLEFNEARSA